MAIHRTPEEIMTILKDYFESKLKFGEYSKLKGIPRTTLSQWLTKYYNATNTKNDKEVSFLNVTTEAKNITTTPKVVYEEDSINQRNQISMKINNITLEFDIGNLKNVLEVIASDRFN